MSDDFEMNPDAIAVIGMAGRFPGAADIAAFWRKLSDGVESVAFFSREELAERGVVAALLDDPLYVRAGAVLVGVELFDAEFFGFTSREAEITDPQHRVFLECAWEALEDSGYDPEAYDGQIGVYAGAGLSTYLLNYVLRRPDVVRSAGALPLQLGNNKDYVPLRVSYKLHLRGPSVNVNTACSSSLVAVHLACQSLLDQQCDLALAGGVGIQVPQDQGYAYAPNGILSPDGHCRAFDARAEGTVSGNGAGLVILKRYAEAVADGDAIRAVILGSAVNNDGAAKVGFTAPSVEGQARVIGEALAVADVDPDTLGYVEAHGTGTPLGDPIEVAALTSVFRSYTARTGFCALGSVKTNVGHLDEAAGVAGLVKTVLALQHAAIPPSLHFERSNPEIDFERSPFYVPTRLSRWAANGAPRRAGVSSFGIGGTNAHVVLQEAPLPEPAAPSRPWQLLLLSARTETALDALTAGLAAHFRETPGIDLADAAYTLLVGRKNFAHRRMVLCRDIDGAVNALESRRPERVVTGLAPPAARPVAFLFPGQGSQHVHMGLGLYRTEPLFRETVDRSAELLLPEIGFDLRTLLYPAEGRAEEAAAPLEQTAVAQPALFTVEYALARLLMSWGIRPQAMIGHSIGEYVAASVAGVFSFEDGLRLVAARGRLMQEMPAGAMLAVELSEDEIGPYLREGMELALANAPSLSVVSGAIAAVDALQRELSARGTACRRLHTSHAFHSASMEPILEPFRRRVREVSLRAPEIPYLSNLTGGWISAEQATDPDYWARHLRHTVRFSEGVRQLLRHPGQVLLEVGPGRALGTLIGRHPECTAGHSVLGALRHPHDPRDDCACLLEAVGRLWLAGACRKPAGFCAHEKRRRVALPTYPFERRRFWLDPPAESAAEAAGAPVSAPVDEALGDWFYLPAWKPRRAAGLPARDEAGSASWLLFLDAEGVGGRLAQCLRGQGRGVATVVAGAAFKRLGDGAYALNSRRPEDYDALLGGLAASGLTPRRIVDLWSVAPPGAAPLERWEDAQRLGFYSLLFLVQALGRRGLVENLCIDVVSNHMQQVTGGELSCPERATLLGLVRVAPKEYPGIRWRSIDLAPPDGGNRNGAFSPDLLLAELLSDDPAPVIAIRGDSVWEQAFEPRHLPAADAAPAPRLREGGTYLITGGLGSMGLALARSLAEDVRAKLVLIGRTGLPPEAEWDRWLHGTGPDVAPDVAESALIRTAIAAVRDIRRLGGEVLAIPADLADESRMRAVLAEVRERFGEIHGVIHTAGVLGQGLIHTKTPEEARKVFAGKAVGLLVLDKLLAEQGTEPDILILCASLASVSPIAGQVDYCAANAFLDAYAAYRSGFGRTAAISIDWGFWQALGMIGQAKMPEASKQRIVDEIREHGRSGAGVEAFRRILAHCPPPQVLVAPDRPEDFPPLQAPAVATAPVTDAPARRRPVHHPWFDECVVETPEIEAYVSRLDIRHWVLNEHRPLGRAVLPGTAYLELARAAMEAHGRGRPLQLSEVYFLVPLMVEDHETKEVRTLLKKRGADFEFVVVSRVEAGADEWLEHARGEIVFLAVEPPSALDPNGLAQRCGDEDIIIGDGDSADDAHPFVRRVRHFSPHWRNFQRLRLGSREALATLRLPAEFAGEPADLPLHPALLDMATGFMSMVDGFESGVPFCYRRVCLWKPLRAAVHSHVRRGENRQPGERTYDATVLDEQGDVLVDVAGFTLKEFERARPEEPETALPEEGRNFCVEIERPGSLATLGLRPDRRRSPAPGEVEIEVAAAGVNFIEVLYALGLLPEPPGGGVRFGLECAGAITTVGEGVAGFRPGDEVYGLAPRAFSRYTTTDAAAIAHKPDHLTLTEAATLPAAYATAYYSLMTRARLQRGERVLIHAASGGVGLAAVNIAEWRGAEIFATAGTPAKREYLRSLGIRHVFDSRSLDFVGQVLAATEGRGVDAVLNSLGGEFIPASLSVLARYGRFLELGKRDIFRNTALSLAPFEKHLAFFAIDVGIDLPEFGSVWRQLTRAVRRRDFPPLPYRELSVGRVAEAFEYMAQGKHIGKVVVAIGGADGVSVSARRRHGRPLADILGRGRTEQRSGHRTTAEAKSPEAARGATRPDPGHARPPLSTAYHAPTGETESKVVAIWQELLGVSGIGVDDDFFDLRGDSLLAAQVTSRLYEAFRVKLPLSSVFEHPTAAGLAGRIERLRESLRELETAPAAVPGEREVEHEL